MSGLIFVTKYCLTGPIYRCEVENIDGRYAYVKWPGGLNGRFMVAGNDWHRTEEEALAYADHMRKARIASMRKKIAELESRSFTVEAK